MLYSVVLRRCISLTVLNLLILVACSVVPEQENLVLDTDSPAHAQTPDAASIPDLIVSPDAPTPTLPLLQPETLKEVALKPTDVSSTSPPLSASDNLYSVVADKLPVKEILRTIARESQSSVSFVGDIEGDITLSVINQPLEYILEQITQLAPVRYLSLIHI